MSPKGQESPGSLRNTSFLQAAELIRAPGEAPRRHQAGALAQLGGGGDDRAMPFVLRSFVWVPVLLAASVASGCKCARDTLGEPTEPADSAASANSAPPTADESDQPEAPADQAQALLDRWVRAQNEADFDAYAAMYAPRFTGVKRAGARVTRFDREGWLDDRKEMFERPFTVQVNDVTVQQAPGLLRVGFEQTWSSKTFRDRGRKQLLLVSGEDGLLISREEMLDSKKGEPDEATDVAFDELALATATSDGFALMLPDPVDLNWATDRPRYVSEERAERRVAPDALPASIREHLDARYEVFDADGHRCEVTPTGFRFVVHVIPHFGTLNVWNGRDGLPGSKPGPEVPEAQRAVDLWRMAASAEPGAATEQLGLTLALEMKPAPRCPDVVWGRALPADDAPQPWSLEHPGPELAREVREAVQRHPVVEEFDRLARADETISAEDGWLEKVDDESLRLIASGDGTVLLYARAYGAGNDCAARTPGLVGLLFRHQKGRLVPLEEPLYLDEPLRGAIDVDQDGQVELIGSTTVFRRTSDGWRPLVDHSPLYLDCPC